MAIDRNELLGTWHLVEWDYTIDGEVRGHPFGRDAQGQIIYSVDGFMSALLMRRERPNFAARNLVSGSAEEKIAALDGYVSYGGSYEVGEDYVIHHVQFSLLPNWIGTDLKRLVIWEATPAEKQLLLVTEPETTRTGRTMINRLRWRRAAS